MLGHRSTKYTESVYARKDQKQALRATNKFKDMMKFSKEDKRLKKLRILIEISHQCFHSFHKYVSTCFTKMFPVISLLCFHFLRN